MSASKGKRGRPREIDKTDVALAALTLFEEKGFDKVTMNELAKAASVSRRTLFRLFPTKSDLVWDGIWDALTYAKEQIPELPSEGVSLASLIQALLLPSLSLLEQPEQTTWARRRLRIIAETPSLFDHPAFQEMRQILTETIEKHVAPTKAPPELLANSLVSVCFASVLWWAKNDDVMTATEALQLAFSTFSELHLPLNNET